MKIIFKSEEKTNELTPNSAERIIPFMREEHETSN